MPGHYRELDFPVSRWNIVGQEGYFAQPKLKLGKYRVQAVYQSKKIPVHGNEYWHGKVTTKPVNFEIVDPASPSEQRQRELERLLSTSPQEVSKFLRSKKATHQNLEVFSVLERTNYTVGEKLQLWLVMKNVGTEPLCVVEPSFYSPSAAVLLTPAGANASPGTWRYQFGNITGLRQPITLKPGQSQAIRYPTSQVPLLTWAFGRAEPGNYERLFPRKVPAPGRYTVSICLKGVEKLPPDIKSPTFWAGRVQTPGIMLSIHPPADLGFWDTAD